MYKILHASSDFFHSSFELEDLETGEHVFTLFYDDFYDDLFREFGLKQGETLDGKIIDSIPPYVCTCTEERAKEISQEPFDGAWLFQWLRVKNKRHGKR